MNTTKKTKRILSILLSLVMVVSLFTGIETKKVYAGTGTGGKTWKYSEIKVGDIIKVGDVITEIPSSHYLAFNDYTSYLFDMWDTYDIEGYEAICDEKDIIGYGDFSLDEDIGANHTILDTYIDDDSGGEISAKKTGYWLCYGYYDDERYYDFLPLDAFESDTSTLKFEQESYEVNKGKTVDTIAKFVTSTTGTITYSLVGDYSAGTSIDGNGKLTVDSDETATEIQVKAESSPSGRGYCFALATVSVVSPSHTHNWNYSANENVIKAWCTETGEAEGNCSYQGESQAVTLTLDAEDTTYSGSAYNGASKVTIKDAAGNKITNGKFPVTDEEIGSITYYMSDGTTKTNTTDTSGATSAGGAPKNAGNYYAAITVGGKTAKEAFTINKKNVAKPTANSTEFVYTSTEQTYTLGNTIGNSDYEVTGNKRTNAGSQTVTVALKDKTNTQWEDGTTEDLTFTFTISTSELKMTAPTGQTKEFNNADQELITAGDVTHGDTSTSAGTMQYQVSDTIATSAGDLSDANWSSDIPKKTTVGKYYVYYRVVPDANHTELDYTNGYPYVVAEITKKIPEYTAPTAKVLTYNGENQQLITAGSTSDGTIAYSLDGITWTEDATEVVKTNAGTYTVYWKLTGDDNHADVEQKTISVKIGQFTPGNGTINDCIIMDGNALSTNAAFSGDTMKGLNGSNLPGAFTWSNGATVPTANGNQTAVFTPSDTINYKTVNVDIPVKVYYLPSGKITVQTNSWNSLLEAITFGIYHTSEQEVAIEGTKDTRGGYDLDAIYYYIDTTGSTTLLTAGELESKWQEYNDSSKPKIAVQSKDVIYAKITDEGGNAVIICSNGIVIDSLEPTAQVKINDNAYATTDNTIFKGAAAISVTIADQGDAGLQTATASYQKTGEAASTSITLTDGTGTANITSPGTYTLTVNAADKAGNTMPTQTYTFEVVEAHIITLTQATAKDAATGQKGTGFVKNDSVIITADAPEDGYVFDHWDVTGDGITLTEDQKKASEITITMPDNNISFTAVYKDIKDPEFKDIEDGKTYCKAVTFAVIEDNLDTVTVNGTTVTLTDGKYTLTADGTTYTIVATDTAGNSTTVTVTVNNGHTWDDGTITLQPNCTEKGTKKYTCTVCGEEREEEIAALGHDFSDEFTVDKEATCEETGSKSKHCSRCEAVKDETEISATGHTEVADAVVAATCTKTGHTEGSHCSVCNKEIKKTEEIPALGHDWPDEWTVIKSATAAEEGKKEKTCKREGCTSKKYEIIPKTGDTDNLPEGVRGSLEKDAEVAPDAPIEEATLDNKKAELLKADNFFDDIEKSKINNEGAKAKVWLEVTKTDETNIASDNKDKIKNEAAKVMGDNPEITYFDADLFKQVGDDGEKKKVSEPGINIKVTIKIPNDLLQHDMTLVREYKIIRLHISGVSSEVTTIGGTFDEDTQEFTFETDKFSTYAIAYADKPKYNGGGSGSGSSGSGGSSSGGGGSYYYSVTGITVTPDKAILTKAGENVQLTANVAPSYATNKNVTWKSDNEAVATVDSTGKVTAVGNGIATITVTTQSGNKLATSVITVNITPEDTAKPSVPTGTDTPIVPTGTDTPTIPTDTDKPVVPGTPKPTTPVETDKPIVSATPVITVTPIVTVTPDAPKPSVEPTAPNGTEAPKETAAPEVTVTPEATITPTVTVAPKPTVKPTEKPKKVTSDFGTLKAKSVKQTSNTITLSWTKLSDADGYLVYGSRCNSKGKKYTRKLIKTIKGNNTLTWIHKKRDKATYYKYQIKAYKIVNGKKVIIAQSVDVHATTKGGKHCVASAVKVTKLAGKKVSKSLKLSLKKGKTAQITASEIPAEKKKTIHHHRDLRYESSNRKVAIVTESGKIKAVGKGTCKIWVYAQNGVYKTITITVK